MIRLSINVLTSSAKLLDRLYNYHFSSMSELLYSRIDQIDAEKVFDFSKVCGWVSINDGAPLLTVRGNELHNLYTEGSSTLLRRNMLSDYIFKVCPLWSSRIPCGRLEAAVLLSADERACFFEAGLLSEDIDETVIEWWDYVANNVRYDIQRTKNDIGRRGEKCTVEYERERTKMNPKWMAINSNLLGYDILSRVDNVNEEKLLIEVKASIEPLNVARFHISANEWNVALVSTAYSFYLWSFYNESQKLAILSPSDILPYIPSNNLEGRWENVVIPFSCFMEKFIDIQ